MNRVIQRFFHCQILCTQISPVWTSNIAVSVFPKDITPVGIQTRQLVVRRLNNSTTREEQDCVGTAALSEWTIIAPTPPATHNKRHCPLTKEKRICRAKLEQKRHLVFKDKLIFLAYFCQTRAKVCQKQTWLAKKMARFRSDLAWQKRFSSVRVSGESFFCLCRLPALRHCEVRRAQLCSLLLSLIL